MGEKMKIKPIATQDLTRKGYCKNCGEKLKTIPTESYKHYVCFVCGSVYIKDKIGRFRFKY